MRIELALHNGLIADQQNPMAKLPGRLDCAFDLRFRPAVRAHRVQGYDAWHGVAALAGFLDVQNFAAFVVAALGAGPMRHLALVAVWTFREGMTFERIMSAPASGACFRVSPFRIWHCRFLCVGASVTLAHFLN